MAGDVDSTSLGDLCDPDRGITYGIVKVGDFVADGVSVIRGGDIRNGRIQIDHEKRVSTEVSQQFQRTILRGGELVINLIAEPGHTAIVPPELTGSNVSRDVGVIPLNASVDHRYVDYCLKSPTAIQWLTSRLQGSVTQKINLATLRDVPIPTPPLVEQRAIAHILGTLDDKIELNRRMNETLEAMARALFKSWFVDFDPVRAKCRGERPLAPTMPPEIADLFPDSFENSELGEIPRGWEVKPLSDCVDVARGLSYKGSGLSESGVPMHNLNSIYEGGGYKHEGLKRYDGEYKPRHVARAGDLIVANTEQGHHRLLIGYAAIVPSRFGSKSLFSHHIYRVRPNDGSKLTADYLCYLLNTSVMHDIVSGYANGTTVNMLPVDGLQSPLIAVPPARAILAFSGIAEVARMRHEEMIEESRTLAALRDTLLPKLISGELRVKDADKFLHR